MIQSSCSQKEGIFNMSYFNTNETFFVIPLNTNDEEIKKINYLFYILEKSGVGDIIKSANY